jgi:hypothetical protein
LGSGVCAVLHSLSLPQLLRCCPAITIFVVVDQFEFWAGKEQALLAEMPFIADVKDYHLIGS